MRVKYLDESFYDVQEYVWVYNVNIGQSAKRFTRAHRTIMHCTKSKDNNFYKDNVAEPYQNPKDKRIQQNIKNGSKGRMPYSWFYFNLVKNVSKDKTFHPCQIPKPLSKMLIGSCTKPNNKVLVLFTGSGNDVLSALELKTKVTTIDKNQDYCTLMKERITAIKKSIVSRANRIYQSPTYSITMARLEGSLFTTLLMILNPDLFHINPILRSPIGPT